jgi:hypothetical protein
MPNMVLTGDGQCQAIDDYTTLIVYLLWNPIMKSDTFQFVLTDLMLWISIDKLPDIY